MNHCRTRPLWLAALTITLLPACAPLGFVASLFESRTLPAQYSLPEKKRILVLVDDWRRITTNGSLTNRVASTAGHFLATAGHADVIPQTEAQALISELGNRWTGDNIAIDDVVSAATVGKKLGADIVIYAELVQLDSPTGETVMQPAALFQVKVFDCNTGAQCFPAPDQVGMLTQPGYGLRTQLAPQRLNTAADAASAVEQELATRAGQDLAELFYRHPKPPPGSTL